MQHSLNQTILRIMGRAQERLVPFARACGALGLAILRGPVKAIFQVLAALLLLFAEWGYEPLAAGLARLSRYFVFAELEAWMQRLPPYGALALFAAPAICLIPVKLMAIYLFATGHPASGVGLIIAAKIAGTAVVARIYLLVRPQLMQIGWFQRGHDRLMPWKERMFAEIRASGAWRTGRIARVEVRRWVNRAWISLLPQRRRVRALVAPVVARVRAFIADLHRGLG